MVILNQRTANTDAELCIFKLYQSAFPTKFDNLLIPSDLPQCDSDPKVVYNLIKSELVNFNT